MEALLFFVFVVWVAPMLVGQHLGQTRNRTGWMWGFWLGWLGVLILACMGPSPSQAEMRLRELEAQHKLQEFEAHARLQELR